MKNNLKMAVALIAFAPCMALSADGEADRRYFTMLPPTIEVSVQETDEAPPLQNQPSPARAAKSVAAAGIINSGVQAWNVINSGRPDGGHSSAYASAIPGFGQWTNLSGWKKKEMTYTFTVTNLLQVQVIKVKYKVAFFYGGTDQRSEDAKDKDKGNIFSPGAEQMKGNYITNFTVRPVQVDVKWGYKYLLGVIMSDPMNIGTSDKPLAYMQADLNWNVATVLSSNGGIYTYGVDGAGNLTDLTEKNSELNKQLPKAETKPVKVDWN